MRHPADSLTNVSSSSIASSSSSMSSLTLRLRTLAEESPSRNSRSALVSLADQLDRGEPWSAAVASVGPSLPAAMRLLFSRTSDPSRLTNCFDILFKFIPLKQELMRGVWLPLLSPLGVFVSASSVALIVLLVFAPMLVSVQTDFGYPDERWTSGVLFALCRIAAEHPWGLSAAWVAVLLTLVLLIWRFGHRCLSHRWSSRLPFFGELSREAGLAEFFDLVAMFVAAQWELTAAVQTAGDVVSHRQLREQSREMVRDLELGIPVESAALSSGLPWSMGHLMRGNPSAQALAESLHGLGQLYAMRAERRAQLFVAQWMLLAPFVVLSGCVLFVFGLISHLFWHTTVHFLLG